MARNAYPGEPLESEQIRLIRLRPGKWTDPIVCELYNTQQVNAHNERVHYYALSYVWGSHGIMRPILLAGQTYHITVNLERALRYSRHHYPDGMILWVDALCIDQTDMKERMHQVQLMGQIYSKCLKMIIYLGERLEYAPSKESKSGQQLLCIPNDDSVAAPAGPGRKYDAHQAFSCVESLAQGGHLASKYPFEPDDKDTSTSSRNRGNRLSHFESLRRLMHDPFTPWWNRVWVIQEAALAPEIDVIHGTLSLKWQTFADAAREYDTHRTSCCSNHIASLPRDEVRILDDFAKRVLAISAARSMVHSKQPLLHLLRTFRDRQASDSRDKVYALLSLANSSIVPDYSKTEAEVFRRATEECIFSSSQSLSVLNSDLGRKFRDDLPSWVPDWSASGSHINNIRAAVATECYRTYPRKCYDLYKTSSITNGALRAVVSHVATAATVDEVMWGDVESMVQGTLHKWWKSVQSIDQNITPSIFWSLISGDVVGRRWYHSIEYRRATSDDARTFPAWALQSRLSPFQESDPSGFTSELVKKWSDTVRLWKVAQMLWPEHKLRHRTWGQTYSKSSCVPCGLDLPQELRSKKIAELLTLLGNPYSLNQMIDDSHQPRGEAPWGELMSMLDLKAIYDASGTRRQDLIPTLDQSVVLTTLYRRLIVFQGREKGMKSLRLGLGPSDTKVGDRLFILRGANTPFILRCDQVGHYRILGDCYVEGLMDDCKSMLGSEAKWEEIMLF